MPWVKNPPAWLLVVRWGFDMLCVISRGNWNNGSHAGGRFRHLNNARSNANNNVGFADSMPNTPHAACADRQRGSPCRGLRRNVWPCRPLVAVAARVGWLAKIGAGHPLKGGAA